MGRNSARVLATHPALRALPGRRQTGAGSRRAMLGESKECHQQRSKVPAVCCLLPSSLQEGCGSWAYVRAQPHGTNQAHAKESKTANNTAVALLSGLVRKLRIRFSQDT